MKKLTRNRWDNVNRWEPVLTEAKVMQAIVKASELRFYGQDLAHQLRVFHATGHTGVTKTDAQRARGLATASGVA